MNRDDILSQNPIASFLRGRSVDLRGSGNVLAARQCAAAIHKSDHWCVTVDCDKGVWHCNDCQVGGTVIDWVMQSQNMSVADAMRELGGADDRNAKPNPIEVAWYDYTDEKGNQLYQVVRFLPKTFRQRHKVDGKWVWSMEGVQRVLYRLPEVLKSDTVIVCEGEKDCDNLVKLGHCATCNVGGAKKWADSYSDALKGKTVYVWPDNDKPGKEHAELVVKSLLTKAKSIFLVEVEEKDASDYIQANQDKAESMVVRALGAAKEMSLIDVVPVKSFPDIELEYQEHVKRASGTCLDLSKWLPSLRCVRPIVPGELVSVLAATGVGKTAILQNIAVKAEPLPILIFELELPGSLMFERFVQIDQGFTGEEIFNSYRDATPLTWGKLHLAHIFFCTRSKIDAAALENIIEKAELKMKRRPAIVMVDYIGLMGAHGTSRYERVSEIAESLKVIAKTTQTIVVFASQIARKGKDDSKEIFLNDGKDSGSVENSSGLVLGAWRDSQDDASTIIVKILKNTKGRAGGKRIECNFNGPTLRITERSPIDPDDAPKPYVD